MENNDIESKNKTEDIDLEDQENNSGDESSEDEQDEMETEQKNEESFESKLAQFEEIINQNKFQYQTYIDIINLTKEHGEFNKLREYREKMSQVFPLTETLWLEWLKDEQKFMDSDQDRQKIDHLFQKAVQDYLSVELWLEYIQFSIGGMGEEKGIENVRNICEKAISFAGLHVTRGYSLWEVYREFETALLAGYQQASAGSIQTPEQTRQINDQISRITRIFKLQLGTCLDNIESTYQELKQFDEALANDNLIKNLFDFNLRKYHELEPFETALVEAASDVNKKLEAYNSYLDFEIKQIKEMQVKLFGNRNVKIINSANDREKDAELLKKSQNRTKCLFERAIADESNCLSAELWLKYSFYLFFAQIEEENQEPLEKKEFILGVFKRAVRNCPWSAKLWINYALESEKATSNQVKEIYGEAMQAGLQSSDDYLELWHAYLGYLRRHLLTNYETETDENKQKIAEEIRDTFQKAINQLFDYFKLNGDPKFSLERFWAKIEARYFKCMDRSRKIYNEMILAKSDIGQVTSEIWLDFYQLEIQYGDDKHQRKLLYRALNELKYDHDKQVICELLIDFEKLSGNISLFSSIYYKNEALKTKIQSQYINQQKNLEKKSETKPKIKKENGQAIKEEKVKGVKRKKSETEKDIGTRQIKDKDGFAIPSLPGTDVKKQKTEQPVQIEFKKVDRNCTVFLSNLKYEVDESKVKEIFEKEPGFLQLRLIKHWSGKTKGYGYVDFEKPEQAEKALRLDRSLVDGRPIFVSKNEEKDSDISSIQNKFKFATSMEKNKLFVSGLPFSTDKQALEDIFKTFGKVKDTRIVTYKSGKSKGLAYVEFEDEQSASKALIQTDGMLIGENQISVAISNPPKRKQAHESRQADLEIKKSLGSGSIESRSDTSSKTTTFVPRSQQLLVRKKTLNLK